MNRADEGALAWALANSATGLLRPGAREWLCAKIGAGEQGSAIRDLLTFYANNSKAELPCELAAPIRTWIRGYVGSDSEPLLRHLYDRIKVSDTAQVTQTSAFTRRRLVAKRSDHAMRVRSTCTRLS